MKIEATVPEIRALLALAEVDARAEELPSEAYQSRRKAIRRHVGGPLVERYETLLDAGRFPVMAAIEGASCSGCHLRLPTMVVSRARRSPTVHTCPHCRRMLYVPELLAGDESVPPRQVLKTAALPKADP